MAPTPEAPSHAIAEARLRNLLRDAELEQPDEVDYKFDPDEVVFLWHQTKLAVVLELAGEHDIASGSS